MPREFVERTRKCFGCGKEKVIKSQMKKDDSFADDVKTATCGDKKCWADRQRWANITRRYGITKEEYLKRLEEQGGVCKVCKDPDAIQTCRGGFLYVDHHHITGKVRGLLCNKCNDLVGSTDEHTEILKKAIAYIEEN